MKIVTGTALLGCWLGGGPGLVAGWLVGMVLDDLRRGCA